jgi:hypothetical protein
MVEIFFFPISQIREGSGFGGGAVGLSAEDE